MSNRSKFVERLASEIGSTKKVADELLETFVGVLRTQLLAEGEAVLPGFGRLLIKERAARKGHNPKTGEPIDIAAKQVVDFKSFPGVLEVPEVVRVAVEPITTA